MSVLHQFIYTKFDPGVSPRQHNDYHLAFYPNQLLSPDDLRDLSLAIHYVSDVPEKFVVFWRTWEAQPHLVVLHVIGLPQDNDQFGRGGIHLAHGVIFPPDVWQVQGDPMACWRLVADRTFASRADVLNSGSVDLSTGDMRPIELNDRFSNEAAVLAPLKTPFERDVAVLLKRLAQMREFPRVIAWGEAQDVAALLGRTSAYLPAAVRARLSWDAGFDAGSLQFPLRILGARRGKLTVLESYELDLAAGTIRVPDGKPFSGAPVDPYEAWLVSGLHRNCEPVAIEQADGLARYLSAAQPMDSSPDTAVVQEFAAANASAIEQSFRRLASRIYPELVVRVFSEGLKIEQKLQMMLDQFPVEQVVRAVSPAIRQGELDARLLPKAVVELWLPHVDQAVRLWLRWAQQTPFNAAEFTTLSADDRKCLGALAMRPAGLQRSLLEALLRADAGLYSPLARLGRPQAELLRQIAETRINDLFRRVKPASRKAQTSEEGNPAVECPNYDRALVLNEIIARHRGGEFLASAMETAEDLDRWLKSWISAQRLAGLLVPDLPPPTPASQVTRGILTRLWGRLNRTKQAPISTPEKPVKSQKKK